MSRPSRDWTFIFMATILSRRSTCTRRDVGCIIVDEYGDVLSDGYNGVARGEIHCKDFPCPGAALKSSQVNHDCQAVHAEINALIRCPDIRKARTLYCTTEPCKQCTRAILNTGITRVVFSQSIESHRSGRRESGHLEWVHVNLEGEKGS